MSNEEQVPGDSWAEKLLATAVVVMLLIALTQAFDWNWFGESKRQEWSGSNNGTASPFRRDWRSHMPYRYLDELDRDDVYLVVETLDKPIEVTVMGRGSREVQRRLHMCMSLAEADAGIQVSPMNHHMEVFKVSVNWGGEDKSFQGGDVASTIRRDRKPLLLWSGEAASYQRDAIWASEAHAEKVREREEEGE